MIGKMKEANENREMEAKRWGRELDAVREQIPVAIQKEKEAMDGRLRDLAGEMKSLKTLVGNRMGQGQGQRPGYGGQSGAAPVNGVGAAGQSGVATPAPETNGGPVGGVNGTAAPEQSEQTQLPQQPAAPSVLPERSASASPYSSRVLGGKAAIPSWQLAAKKRADDAKKDAAAIPAPTNGMGAGAAVQDVGESGAVTPAVEGEVVA